MTYRNPARTTARRTQSTILAGLFVGGLAMAWALGYQMIASSSSNASPLDVLGGEPVFAPPLRSDNRGALAEDEGAAPSGTTVFDDDVPAVANLAPDLLDALRLAANDAARDGIRFTVNDGWRSPAYQEQLLREAIAKYGSAKEAARWVASPTKSAHVSGDAVDIGPLAATTWLSKHGAAYGLCQIYRNEPWHYELRPDATEDGCPAMYADPTRDPRLRP
ncbi:MAG: M15 family metallopeptidase [Dehalococcoidia bacterium]